MQVGVGYTVRDLYDGRSLAPPVARGATNRGHLGLYQVLGLMAWSLHSLCLAMFWGFDSLHEKPRSSRPPTLLPRQLSL